MSTPAAQIADRLYDLFQTLPPETQQSFLTQLFQRDRGMLEDFFFYLACQEAQTDGFLSEQESQSFVDSLPQ